MRKLLRGIAKYRMKKAGIHKPNKRPRIRASNGVAHRGSSIFAENWRKYV